MFKGNSTTLFTKLVFLFSFEIRNYHQQLFYEYIRNTKTSR